MTYMWVTLAPDSSGESSPKSHQMVKSSPSGSNGSVVNVTVVLAITVGYGRSGTNGAAFAATVIDTADELVLSWRSQT